MAMGCGCGGGSGGGGTCEEIGECLKEFADGSQCIRIDPTTGKLAIWISNTDGNALTCTPNGLYVPGDDIPPVPPIPRIVCYDPADPQASTDCYIAFEGGRWLNPTGSPSSVDFCVDQGFHLHGYVFATGDGIAVWGPTWRETPTSQRASNGDATLFGDLPSVSAYTALDMEPGNPTNKVWRSDRAFNQRRVDDGDGGFFGFNAPHFTGLTLRQVIERVNRKRVILADMANPAPTRTQDVNAARDAILAAGGKDWVLPIIDRGSLDQVTALAGAGLKPVVDIANDTDVTPQQLVDAGAAYVWFSRDEQPDLARRQEFAATLPWLCHGTSRHWWAAQALGEGACAIAGSDPLHMRGHDPTKRTYQRDSLFTGYGVQPGSLTAYTDVGRMNRAYDSDESPAAGPGKFMSIYASGSGTPNEGYRTHLLLGALAVDDPQQSQVVMWDMMITSILSQPTDAIVKAGIAIGQASDADNSGVYAATPDYGDASLRNYYRFMVRLRSGGSSGEMVCYRMVNGGSITVQSLQTQAINPNSIVRCSIECTPSQMQMKRYSGFSPIATMTVNERQYTGPYVWAIAETASTGTPQFEVKFSDITNYIRTADGQLLRVAGPESASVGDDFTPADAGSWPTEVILPVGSGITDVGA
jgi:hypothetical protein